MLSAPGDPTVGKRICRCQIPDKAAKTHLSHPEKRNLREHSPDYGLKAMKAVPRSGETTFPRLNKAHEEPHWKHPRSEEHTSELQSLMRISYAVFCLQKKT